MTDKPETRDIPLMPDLMMEEQIINYLADQFSDLMENSTFLEKKPFPYMVMDDFLPEIICEFIETKGRNLKTFNDNIHMNSKKKAEHRYWKLDDDIRDCISIFYSDKFVGFLERITGIKGLIADTDYNWGGGFHILPQGGFLNVHKDFNIHPHMKLHRRLNLLIYLNKGWTAEDGGQLEFWDMEKKEQVASIVPVFNRAGLFETSEISYHGNPNKVTRSDGYGRMAYNLYYYTVDRPDADKITPHTTIYVDTPGQVVNKVRSVVNNIIPKKVRQYLLHRFKT